jgi:hypothetical protein
MEHTEEEIKELIKFAESLSDETIDRILEHAEDDELAHFGVKGMRWGVRKNRRSGASGPESEADVQRRLAAREVIKRNPKLLYKYRKDFTEEELQKAVSVLKLEREIRSLKKSNITAGADYAEAFLKYGTVASDAYKLYSSPLGNALAKKLKLPVIAPAEKEKKK